ncbi:MAG: hypothetical protein M0Z31_13095 [Clostridia bacterium]|nr:hypothetical protein [Clostridia bacterium]
MRKNIIVISSSILVGIGYIILFSRTKIIDLYKNIFPNEPDLFWDTLPLILTSIILGLVIGKSAMQKIRLFIISLVTSSFTVMLILALLWQNTFKDFR